MGVRDPSRLLLSCVAITLMAAPKPGKSEEATWHVKDASLRAVVEVKSGPYRREDEVVLLPMPIENPFGDQGAEKGFLDPIRLRLYEIKTDAAQETPCDYADSNLLFRLSGKTSPLKTRTFHLYLALLDAKPNVVERRGKVLGANEPVPGQNLLKNPSFEAEIRSSSGEILTSTELEKTEHTNLVPDATFEEGQWDLRTKVTPYTLALEKGKGRDGGTGLVINSSGKSDATTVLASSPSFKVVSGVMYQFRFWQRLEPAPSEGSVEGRLDFFGADGKSLVGGFRAYSRDKPNSSWQQWSYLGTAPPSAVFGRVQIKGKKFSEGRAIVADTEVHERLAIPGWHRFYHYYDPGMEMGVVEDEGNRVMRLSTSPKGTKCTATLLSERFPIKPNTRYIGGGRVKILKPAAAAVSFKVFDKEGKPAMKSPSAFMAVREFGESDRWEEIENGAITSPKACWGQVVVSIGWGEGDALFDDVYLQEVPRGQSAKVAIVRVEKR